MQNKAFSIKKTLNVGGRILDVSSPVMMGILNVTPDSFYDGSRFTNEADILKQAEKMLRDGATFIDVGGYSTRPGAADIPIDEELARVVPAVRAIKQKFPEALISVDTFRGKVAREAVESGAVMVNDISAGSLDHQMLETVRALAVPYVLMHMKGNPRTMNALATYENVTREVLEFFHEKVHHLTEWGIKDIIVDPGFGFAKSREHNFELLFNLEKLQTLGKPMIAGLSRKSMIWKTLGIEPKDALNGTTSLNTIALMKGTNILRVHDTAEAAELIKLFSATMNAGQSN